MTIDESSGTPAPDLAQILELVQTMAADADRQRTQIDELRSELASVRAGANPPVPIRVVHQVDSRPDADNVDQRTTRRKLLRNGAVALGVGAAAAGLGSRPAAAADNDPLTIGQANSGSTRTFLQTNLGNFFAFGVGNAGPGSSIGIQGSALGESGTGLLGIADSSTGSPSGVRGRSIAPSGRAVFGHGESSTGLAVGVLGRTNSATGAGVLGDTVAATGTPLGVQGKTSAPGGTGVSGINLAATGDALAVVGLSSTSPTGVGAHFRGNGAAIATQGPISIRPSTASVINTAPVAPVHVLQDGAGTPVELLLQLESDTAPQQTFVNNTTNSKWFFAMTSDDEFKISKDGTGKVEAKFFSNGNLNLAGTLNQASDVNVKHDLTPVDHADVLDKLAAMPMFTWKYDADPDVTHLGPTAQDFAAAFNLGESNTTIATVDADGVALAAIQALHQQDLRHHAELQAMRTDLDQMQAKLGF